MINRRPSAFPHNSASHNNISLATHFFPSFRSYSIPLCYFIYVSPVCVLAVPFTLPSFLHLSDRLLPFTSLSSFSSSKDLTLSPHHKNTTATAPTSIHTTLRPNQKPLRLVFPSLSFSQISGLKSKIANPANLATRSGHHIQQKEAAQERPLHKVTIIPRPTRRKIPCYASALEPQN